jgi:glutaminyl-tRNA synthetase
VRLYGLLFRSERSDDVPEGGTIADLLDPASLEVVRGFVEPGVAADPPGSRYQFERQGYFCSDPVDSRADALVFNRIVTLREVHQASATARVKLSMSASAEVIPGKSAKASTRPPRKTRAELREKARAASPALAARFSRYTAELGLGADEADLLTCDLAVGNLFEDAIAAGASPASAAGWVANEVLRELKDTPVDALPFGGAALAGLIALVEDGTVSATGAKEVFAEMMRGGGEPRAIVERLGLQQVTDAGALEPLVDAVLDAHPDHVTRYRDGKTGLLGFFVGQVMKASGGTASPALVQELVRRKLA